LLIGNAYELWNAERKAEIQPAGSGVHLARALVMDARELKTRSMRFALDITALCVPLYRHWPGSRVADQMFRSATGVAANYRAACRARSRREFIAKVGTVVEEAEETVFWLEFASEVGLDDPRKFAPLLGESRELLAIFTSSAKTAAENQRPRG
jgi:four helix bundle protein